jgi:hypothetical protein
MILDFISDVHEKPNLDCAADMFVTPLADFQINYMYVIGYTRFHRIYVQTTILWQLRVRALAYQFRLVYIVLLPRAYTIIPLLPAKQNTWNYTRGNLFNIYSYKYNLSL